MTIAEHCDEIGQSVTINTDSEVAREKEMDGVLIDVSGEAQGASVLLPAGAFRALLAQIGYFDLETMVEGVRQAAYEKNQQVKTKGPVMIGHPANAIIGVCVRCQTPLYDRSWKCCEAWESHPHLIRVEGRIPACSACGAEQR